MERLTRYRKIIRDTMELVGSRTPVNMPGLKNHLVVDKDENDFLLLSIGWHNAEFVHDWVYHLQVKDGKIWVLEDLTDPSIIELLEEKGIPPRDIIPVYHPDYQPIDTVSAA